NSYIQNGNLQIVAKSESYLGNRYTSARIQTKRKFSTAYGRIEARIKIPSGKGIWPAFWMLGEDIDTVNWPACGEIDIMEHVNNEATVYATVHMPGPLGDSSIGYAYSPLQVTDFSTDFHIFATEWDPGIVRFYVDNTLIQTVTRGMLSSGQRWVFDHPFFLVLNVAVGGVWPGYPDATTPFPAVMQVDYVRVYARNVFGTYLPIANYN
ncbi:MAG TPA: glycoside hydrolase family 16 protein, partial [Anaerolineae bacterium]